jgi:aspartate/methionine/tyrosine aminotransferase
VKFKLGMAVGAGIGYLVGSGKGRELIEQVRSSRAQRSADASAPFQEVVTAATRRTTTITGSDDPLAEPAVTSPPIGTGVV